MGIVPRTDASGGTHVPRIPQARKPLPRVVHDSWGTLQHASRDETRTSGVRVARSARWRPRRAANRGVRRRARPRGSIITSLAHLGRADGRRHARLGRHPRAARQRERRGSPATTVDRANRRRRARPGEDRRAGRTARASVVARHPLRCSRRRRPRRCRGARGARPRRRRSRGRRARPPPRTRGTIRPIPRTVRSPRGACAARRRPGRSGNPRGDRPVGALTLDELANRLRSRRSARFARAISLARFAATRPGMRGDAIGGKFRCKRTETRERSWSVDSTRRRARQWRTQRRMRLRPAGTRCTTR